MPLTKTKEELEKEKLEAEIDNLKKPFYKKIGFWSLVVTAVISVITARLLFINGAFDTKTAVLDARKENLTHDVNKLEDEKRQFKTDSSSFADTIIQLKKTITELRVEEDNFKKIISFYKDTSNVKGIRKELTKVAIENDYLNRRIKGLNDTTNFYHKVIDKLEEIIDISKIGVNYNQAIGAVLDSLPENHMRTRATFYQQPAKGK